MNERGLTFGGKSNRKGWATAQTPNDLVIFCCEDNNVAFMHMRPHLYRVRQVESCHRLGEVVQISFFYFFMNTI